MLKVIHVVNQFFAGIGGEEQAGIPVAVADGAVGAARGLQFNWAAKRRSFARFILATIIFTSAMTRR